MTVREDALRSLVVGDIFHARFIEVTPAEVSEKAVGSVDDILNVYLTERTSTAQPSLICFVEEVTNETIVARTVSAQVRFTFDRTVGRSECWEPPIYFPRDGKQPMAEIDSVAPLPSNVHNGLIALDRHHRLGRFSGKPNRNHLSEEHKQALLFSARHYPENPL
jgi:hypothetical protein